MKLKKFELTKNILYVFTSNVSSLFISMFTVLFFPKILNVEEFGYWQIYLFYSAFLGFLHFGWNDGIYLRYGGQEYSTLNKKRFFSQFWMLIFLQLGLFLIINFILFFVRVNDEVLQIALPLTLCMIIVNSRLMLLYILQITNRIKEYALVTFLERIIFFAIITVFIVFTVNDASFFIIADLIAKFLLLIYSTLLCKEIVYKNIKNITFDIKEILLNISVGIKLMLANIASMLIIGIVRFGINIKWDVVTFAKVSLILSISNLIFIFVNSISLVIYPILKRVKPNSLSLIYLKLRRIVVVLLLTTLTFYFPIKGFLDYWLPNYKDSLIYLFLIFPLGFFEGKMNLLINTYYKTLRKEKELLTINALIVVMSFISTLVTVFVMENLTLTILLILFLIGLRSTISELILANYLQINLKIEFIFEKVLILLFILIAYYFSLLNGFILFSLIYSVYLWCKKEEIREAFIILRK